VTIDYDVCVIGGGPAGIAAAVRVRWLKRHHCVPCKVLVIDPAELGGLAAMGSTVLTGLGFQMTSDVILERLLTDVRTLEIPHERKRVTAVLRESTGDFRIQLAGGEGLTCRAVVLACGMRTLTREAEFWGRGVTGLSMGVDHVIKTLRRYATDSEYRHVVFVGSPQLLRLRALLEGARRDSRQFRFIVEPIEGEGYDEAVAPFVGSIERLEGEGRLSRVCVRRPTGVLECLEDVDLLVMDFMSLEARPSRSVLVPGLEVDERGFIVVDRGARTSVPGLFAAGDATGMPACVAKAIGEGVIAGFEAYRYVYRSKFEAEPQLFAYYPWEGELEAFTGELPSLDGSGLRVELLADRERVLSVLEKEGAPPSLVTEMISGEPRSVEMLALAAVVPQPEVERVTRKLLIQKVATLR
jgi:thioredoxin reductase (NADPH)